MTEFARYDSVADLYATGWSDDVDDPVSACLFDLLGAVSGQRILEIACGHGRISRELARRNAQVVGVDLSSALIGKANSREQSEPLGIRYRCANVADSAMTEQEVFDSVVCSFGLSDIDELDGAVANVNRALRPGGVFVFTILHPCFPGAERVSGAWPSTGRYYDEGWWRADGSLSSLRQNVGANHRTLATYLNTFRRHDLWLDEVAEPEPTATWAAARADAGRFPVFLAARCVKGRAMDVPAQS